jgi:hypothetical protein
MNLTKPSFKRSVLLLVFTAMAFCGLGGLPIGLAVIDPNPSSIALAVLGAVFAGLVLKWFELRALRLQEVWLVRDPSLAQPVPPPDWKAFYLRYAIISMVFMFVTLVVVQLCFERERKRMLREHFESRGYQLPDR